MSWRHKLMLRLPYGMMRAGKIAFAPKGWLIMNSRNNLKPYDRIDVHPLNYRLSSNFRRWLVRRK